MPRTKDPNPESRIPNPSFLHHAIRLGERGFGRTWPNPSVGCVLVKEGTVIAATRTGDGGRPHAETLAIEAAGAHARGATAYVSLEPCAHVGQTGSCAQALIDAGITRVVYGAEDPDPRVSGKGAAMLRAAGIEVIASEDAQTLIRGFTRRIRHTLPFVTMKLATSADQYMSYVGGKPRWITSEASRYHAHGLRGRSDAILTGIGTVLSDDPQLNCRIAGAENPHTTRVVADRNLRLPLDSVLVRTARQQPTWVLTTTAAVEAAASHATDLSAAGVVFLAIEDEHLSPMAMLKTLASQGINELMIEAGPVLCTHFLESRCVDRLFWYRAPITLGATGASPMRVPELPPPAASFLLADDRLDVYDMASCLPD